ncbi:Dual oxidase maturation factor 1 [Armadillidium vulgare]|nr:Dual oxidase maturation factor 1 [Armadillidium vulgare]
MSYSYHKALSKGLPYPILTAAEYLTIDKEAFAWGRNYRNAGYYTSIALWASFASWLLANILLLNVPRYGAYMLIITGCLMILADLIYLWLKPNIPLVIRIEESVVTFRLGWCFWIIIVVGTLAALSGLIISIVDWIYPNKFSTILEVDFDTPYDRHIIIEDSLDTRKRRFKIPRLEEPLNVTSKCGFTSFATPF